MSGSFGEMGNLLKQAQEMQRELERVKRELAAEEVEGSAGAGAVRVRLSGAGEARGVEISAEAIANNDRGMLEDLVLAAVRDALTRAEKLRQERMSTVTGGLNLPGIF